MKLLAASYGVSKRFKNPLLIVMDTRCFPFQTNPFLNFTPNQDAGEFSTIKVLAAATAALGFNRDDLGRFKQLLTMPEVTLLSTALSFTLFLSARYFFL